MSVKDNIGFRGSEASAWTWVKEDVDFAPSPPSSASRGSENGEEEDDRDRPEDHHDHEVGNTGKQVALAPLLSTSSHALSQYSPNTQPRHILGLEKLRAAGVLADRALLLRYTPDTIPSLSGRSAKPTSTHSFDGSLPPHSMPIIGETPDLYDPTELIPSQCFFKDILETNCNQNLRTREEFHNHMLSHFNGPPPGKALCIFCNLEFENENPWSCWAEYLDHIRYQHFRNGMMIEQMRPDFVTWAYLRDTGVLAQARYILICDLANERQPWKYSFLRAANWEPPSARQRRLAKERQAEEENIVRITERPTRRKRLAQSSRQGQYSRQGQSNWQLLMPEGCELPQEKDRRLAKERLAEKEDTQTCREGSSAYEIALCSPESMFSPSDGRNEPGSSSNAEVTKKHIQGDEQGPRHWGLCRTTCSNLQKRQDSFHQQEVDPYAFLSLFDGPDQQPTRAEKGQAVQGSAATDQDKLPWAQLKGKYWPCVLKDILQTPCNSKDLTNFEKWFNHSKAHTGWLSNSSTTTLICLFCKKLFQKQDGNSFSERLDKYLEHMFHHLVEGAVVEDVRCDEITLEYLNSLGMLSKKRYGELKSLVENQSKEKEPCASSSLSKEATEQSSRDEYPAPNDPSAGDSIKTPQNETLGRKQRRRKPWVTKSNDDDAQEPLLARKLSLSSSATSSNVDWSHCPKAPLVSAMTGWGDHLEHELADADNSPSGSGACDLNNGPTTEALQPVSSAAGTQPAEPAASSENGTAIASNMPPPPSSQPPPNPPPDSTTTTPPSKKTKLRRLLELLSCSEAIMFYIQSFQLSAISFQVACTTLYFSSTPPPLSHSGKFSDSDYLSLLSTCLVQTIALALSLIGMRRRGDENLWIWSATVASISFMLSIASLVLYFVYTTFGNLFMCLAAVCQLWIWKFVIFGARSGRRKEWGGSASSDCSIDLEMQMTTMTSVRSTL